MNGYLAGDCAIKLSKHDTRLVEVGITVQKEHHIKGIAKKRLVYCSIICLKFSVSTKVWLY